MKKILLILGFSLFVLSSISCMEQEQKKSNSAQEEQSKKVYVLKLTNYLTQEIKNALEPMGVKFLVLAGERKEIKKIIGFNEVVSYSYFVKILNKKFIKEILNFCFVEKLTKYSLKKIIVARDSNQTNFRFDQDYSNSKSRFLIEFFEKEEAEKFKKSMTKYICKSSEEFHRMPWFDEVLGTTYTCYEVFVVLTDNYKGRKHLARLLSNPGVRNITELDYY